MDRIAPREDVRMERPAEVRRLLTEWRSGSASRPPGIGRARRSRELYRETGDNFRSVRVTLDEERFQLDTHDMGPATEEFWGDSDYEFWAIVACSEWPRLLGAFAAEVQADSWATEPGTWEAVSAAEQGRLLFEIASVLFEGDARATDHVRDICAKHGVEYSGGSWV